MFIRGFQSVSSLFVPLRLGGEVFSTPPVRRIPERTHQQRHVVVPRRVVNREHHLDVRKERLHLPPREVRADLEGQPVRPLLESFAGGREQVFPRTLDVKNDGIDEVLFDAFDVPDGENVRLTLSATVGEANDTRGPSSAISSARACWTAPPLRCISPCR